MNVVIATWKLFQISLSVSIGSQQPSCFMPKAHLLSVVCRWIFILYTLYIYIYICFHVWFSFDIGSSICQMLPRHIQMSAIWWDIFCDIPSMWVMVDACLWQQTNLQIDHVHPWSFCCASFVRKKCWCGFWHILVWTTVTITEHQFTSEGLKMVPDRRIIAKWWVPRK